MTVLPIDDVKPFVSVNSLPVQWGTGAAALRIVSSRLTRLHPRGIFFKPRIMRFRGDLDLLGWTKEQCIPSAAGLCETKLSVMFPFPESPVVSEKLEWLCSSGNTGRVIVNTSRYDTSACDIIDNRMDFVYANGYIFSASTALPDWVYWTICLMVVYLVRCLSRFVLSSLGESKLSNLQKLEPGSKVDPKIDQKIDQTTIKQTPAIINQKPATMTTSVTPDTLESTQQSIVNTEACLAVCGGCMFLVLIHGDHMFTTQEDLILHWFSVFYVGAYAALLAGTRLATRFYHSSRKDPPFYNLLAGVLQMVASRLYAGAETPYNAPLIFIISMRAITKSRRRVDLLRAITLLLDSIMLGLMAAFGFGYPKPYLTAVLTAAAAAADLLVY